MSCVFFCKHKTAYEMRISDWSSDVFSSVLPPQQSGTDQRVLGRSTRLARDRDGWRLCDHSGRLAGGGPLRGRGSLRRIRGPSAGAGRGDRKSVVTGKNESVRVQLGGWRKMKKKKT